MSNGENNKREDAEAEGVAMPQAEDSAAMTEAPAEEPKNPTESAEAPKSAAEVKPAEEKIGAPEAKAAKKGAARVITSAVESGNKSQIDEEKILAKIGSWNYPENVQEITKVIHWIETRALSINAHSLVENLARWAEAANKKRDNIFLQKIASCARTYDTFGEADIDVFISLFRIAPEIAASYEDCERVITDVIDRHSDDFGVVLDGLLMFFRRDDNCKYLTNFFKLLFTSEDGNENKNLVNAAWSKILCDAEINTKLADTRYFHTKPGKSFARHIRKHRGAAVGRAMPEALTKFDQSKVKGAIKLIGIAAALVVIAIVSVIGIKFANNNAMDKSTIVIDYPETVTLDCGQELDLAGLKISYKTNGGVLVEVDGSKATVSHFDPTRVGEQTVTIKYGGKTHTVKVTVNAVALSAPTLKLEGGKVIWDPIEGAGKYLVEIKDTDGNMISESELTDTTSFAIDSTFELGAYEAFVTAIATESRWLDSPVSKKLSFEKREGVTEISYEDGKIVWTAISGAKGYKVTLNDEELDAKNPSIERALKGGSNIIKVSVVYDGNIVYTEKTVTIKKLTTPSLTVSNRQVICNDSGVVFYLDGVEFDGNLATAITEPGEYALTAKRFATSEGEIDSDELAPITITKLPTPLLTIADNTLVVQEGYTAEYYLNGEVFSGNILDVINPDTYTVTAKFKGQNSFVLDSEMSNAVEFSKLAVPNIEYDIFTKSVSIKNAAAKYEFYLNGEVFDGNVASLGAGYYEVTARNVGDGISSISSAESNTLYISNTEAKIEVADQNNGQAKIKVATEIENIKYDIQVKFYQGGVELDSWQKTNCTTPTQTVMYNRGNQGIADKLVITVILIPPNQHFESETLEYTWTR